LLKLVGGLVLLVVLVSKIGTAGEVDPAKIEAIFADLKSETAPGAAVLVLKDGRVLFSRGYGVTDLRSFGKIDAQTNFRLGIGEQAVHGNGHHAARPRRQTSPRRPVD
jgi:hypothetical protein